MRASSAVEIGTPFSWNWPAARLSGNGMVFIQRAVQTIIHSTRGCFAYHAADSFHADTGRASGKCSGNARTQIRAKVISAQKKT